MILIADAGSTKTDWADIDGNVVASTSGINPSTMSPSVYQPVIQEVLSQQISGRPEKIYFYGAGCKNEYHRNELADVFSQIIPDIEVSIHSDLLGAARATLKNEPGIISILGTGSSCGYFDGKEITQSVPSLGFILDDHGSGAHLGKQLLLAYFKETMPRRLRNIFEAEYKINIENVIERVYHKPQPSHFLGSLVYFLDQHVNNSFINNLIRNSFITFFAENILPLKSVPGQPLYFVGSIADAFRPILEEVIESSGFETGVILKTPIIALTDYHRRYD